MRALVRGSLSIGNTRHSMNENTKKEAWISRNRYVAFVVIVGLIDFVVRGAIRGQLNPSSLFVVAIAALAASYADKKRRES